MRDRALTHGGMAFSALGQLDRAVELLAQVPEGSRMYPEARVELGRALRRKKDFVGAILALTPLAERPAPSFGKDLGAAALLEIADIAAVMKDTGTEVDALESIWAAHPLAPEAELAEVRLKKRPRTLTARVVRAESLVDAHRNKQGLELLEPLLSQLELPDPLACRAHFVHGKALRKERQHTLAIARLRPVVDECLEPGLRVRALYVLGSSSSIVDQDRGIEVYRRLAREFPSHSFADDALFFAADLLMKRGRLDEALVHLAELARLYPDGDFAGEALFKSYWVHRTRGEVEKGLALLTLLESRYADAEKPMDFERARYWRARTLLDQGQRDEALALFHQLAVERPATYYGLSARQRTLELDPSRAGALTEALRTPREGISPWPLHAGPLGKDPHFVTAIELLRMGFPQAVASELLAANRNGVPAEATRLIVFLLDRLGDERAAHAVARISLHRDLSGRITPKTRRVWEVAFPLAFRDKVEKHSAPTKVPADLLQGLMREESALDPNALSWAGALGLVQLMPSTARAVAAQLKLRRPLPKDLLDPDLNLKLGATYLGGTDRALRRGADLRGRQLQRRAGRHQSLAPRSTRHAARRLGGGDPHRRDARLREEGAAFLQHLPAPLCAAARPRAGECAAAGRRHRGALSRHGGAFQVPSSAVPMEDPIAGAHFRCHTPGTGRKREGLKALRRGREAGRPREETPRASVPGGSARRPGRRRQPTRAGPRGRGGSPPWC